jgi:hypothetical protein
MITIVLLLFSVICHQCYSQVCSASGFDFTAIAANNNYQASWNVSNPPQTISYAPCSKGTPTGCGNKPDNQCSGKADCCAVCQTWEGGSGSACLGLSSNFMGVTEYTPLSVKLSYGKGDYVDVSSRQVDIYIYCDPTASVLSFDNFIPAFPQNPAPPVYLYKLYLGSSSLCSNVTSSCSATGFNFAQIAAIQDAQATWLPSPGLLPQNISYAPCSAGTSTGCGIQGPPYNQCTGKSNCCAVCQSWQVDVGNQGACLGLSNDLLGVTILTPVSVKITYGSGDMVDFDNTPRRVDVYISCDPAASTMTFVKFIQAPAQNPPPPYYLYQLFLASSTLCNTQMSDFLSSLGISFP